VNQRRNRLPEVLQQTRDSIRGRNEEWLRQGDYLIQVQTSEATEGQSRFSLRAGPPDFANGVLDVGQATSSRDRLPIYANTSSADTQFFLARVPPIAGSPFEPSSSAV
jgi:hypothetical protein